MMVAKFDNARAAQQLEETLLEAGFTAQEISLSVKSISSSSAKIRTSMKPTNLLDATCYLTVQTQTQADEDLAKAVFHDCGVEMRQIEESSRFALLPLKKTRGEPA